MVLDRILLWIFSVACVAGTCGIILVAPSLYDARTPLDILVSKISKRELLPAPVAIIQRTVLQWSAVVEVVWLGYYVALFIMTRPCWYLFIIYSFLCCFWYQEVGMMYLNWIAFQWIPYLEISIACRNGALPELQGLWKKIRKLDFAGLTWFFFFRLLMTGSMLQWC